MSPDAAKSFAFFEKKNEEFYDLLSKHSMKALGVITQIVGEVIYIVYGYILIVIFLK